MKKEAHRALTLVNHRVNGVPTPPYFECGYRGPTSPPQNWPTKQKNCLAYP
jgi:hypothetical protein